jgi:hypothetical protein
MKETSEVGINRTGLGSVPKHRKQKEEEAWKAVPESPTDGGTLREIRMEYARKSGPVGSVPPPPTLKGKLTLVVQTGLGRKPSLFIDKLAERLAFERTGTRLYEALIAKFEAGDSPTGPVSGDILRTFHDEELRHFGMLWKGLEKLGADPTVQTPGADLAGVESMGLMQALNDPRATFSQALHCILTAELVDNEGWRTLIELAEEMVQREMADDFRAAMVEEAAHLTQVRDWISALEKVEAKVD